MNKSNELIETEYRAYIAAIDAIDELRALANYDDMRDDMNERDAFDELRFAHNDDISIIINRDFLIAHCEYSSRAMMHYAATEFNCRCIEYCASNDALCKICA